MPNLSLYKTLLRANTVGDAHKMESDLIMEETWDTDIATRDCYFYDWYHDDDVTKLSNIDPTENSKKIPMRVKYLVNASQTMDKDAVTFHLQMKPSQQCVVDYYDEYFANRYHSIYPVGLYVDIQDANGNYNRWMVVAPANINNPQFPTFEILRCDYVVQYIVNRVKYQVPAVLRSQSSYNSGVWTDNLFTSTEDQQKFIVPLNRDTEHIYYNQRFLIDGAIKTEPRAWQVTKVNRVGTKGICLVTLAQTQYNEHTDYIETNTEGNVIGLWADYYSSSIDLQDAKEEQVKPVMYSKITYSGLSPEIKVGGNYKKFTVAFYDEEKESAFQSGLWKYEIDEKDASSVLNILTSNESSDVNENQVKVKFVGDKTYLNKKLVISYISDSGITSSVEVEIKGL